MSKTKTRTEADSDSVQWEKLVTGGVEGQHEFKRLWKETFKKDPEMVEYMGFQNYTLIQLQESNNPEYKYGAQYVGINEFRCHLERETLILVAESILENLRNAENYGRREDRREDVRIMSQGGSVDCFTAHKKRLSGEVKVIPDRLPQHVKTYLEKEL